MSQAVPYPVEPVTEWESEAVRFDETGGDDLLLRLTFVRLGRGGMGVPFAVSPACKHAALTHHQSTTRQCLTTHHAGRQLVTLLQANRTMHAHWLSGVAGGALDSRAINGALSHLVSFAQTGVPTVRI